MRINNDAVIQRAGLTYREMDDVENREWEDLIRQGQRFRGSHGRISLKGRVALIVDDGVATGATAQAACQVARAQGARTVVLAVPIVAAEVADQPPSTPTRWSGLSRRFRTSRSPRVTATSPLSPTTTWPRCWIAPATDSLLTQTNRAVSARLHRPEQFDLSPGAKFVESRAA